MEGFYTPGRALKKHLEVVGAPLEERKQWASDTPAALHFTW
jgi:uncharacterized membrane protein